MDDIMGANLYDLYGLEPGSGDIDTSLSGGVSFQSIGGDRFRCVLPDGRAVIVDPNGNIIG